MARNLTEDQRRFAEQIIRRWTWAGMLSAQADRTVEQGAVGSLAVALLEQLLGDYRRGVVETSQ
ncbi:MAG TPA: hypothetical protein VGJ95_00425 [Pseudonocardiaceae bacterium]|jgi:hypothetical protein